MAVGIPIRWADNTKELISHLKEGLNQIVATEAGAKKLMDSLSGDRMMVAAHKYAAAISEIGGASKLTTGEAAKADSVFDKWIAKAKVMGVVVPDAMRNIAAETKAVAVAEKEAADAAKALEKAAKDAADAAKEQTAALAKQAKDLADSQHAAYKRMIDGMDGVAQGAKTLGMSMTAGITLPLAALATAGVSASAPFEAALKRMVSLAGVTQEQLAGVKEHILALAPAVGIGPQKLAEAMTIISSTVSDTGTALQILDTAAKGSAAGLGDAFDVAKALTAVINSYGAANITAARAADVLVQTVKDGGAEAKELAPVLANVVPIAAQLGVSFEEVGANIATVTKLGIPAAEAITQLTSVFSGMLKETSKGREAFKSIGMSYAELRAEIKEKGLMATLIRLNEEFKNQPEMLAKIFGRIEAMRNVMSTAGQQAEIYADVLTHLMEAAGSLDGAFEQMKGTQIQTWNELRAAVDVIAIRFGDALAESLVTVLEAAKPVLDTIIKMVEAFAKLPQPVIATVIAMGAILAVIGPLLIGFGAIVGAIKTLVVSYVAVQTFFAGAAVAEGAAAMAGSAAVVAEGAVAVEGAALAGGAAMTGFGVALTEFAAAAVWPVTIIVGIGIALYELYQHSETARQAMDDLAGTITGGVVEAWQTLKDIINDTGRILRDLFIIQLEIAKNKLGIEEWNKLTAQVGKLRDAVKKLSDALHFDLSDALVHVLKQVPGLGELIRAIQTIAALRSGLSGTADKLDEIASIAQGSLVGVRNIGTGQVGAPPNLAGGLQRGNASPNGGVLPQRDLLAAVRELTDARKADIIELHKQKLTTLEISDALTIEKDIVGVVIRQYDALQSAQKKGRDATMSYAEALERYNAVGTEYEQLLGRIGNALYEAIAADAARINSTAALAKIYKVHEDVIKEVINVEKDYKKEQKEITDAAKKRGDIEKEIAKIIKDRTEELNRIVIAGLDDRLKAQQEYDREVKRMTLSAEDFQRYEIEVQIRNQEALGKTLVGNAKATSDLIIATLKLRLEQIGKLWKDNPMVPPKATFDAAKREVVSFSDAIGRLAQSFTQLAQISGGTFGGIAKVVGAAFVGLDQFVKAFEQLGKLQKEGGSGKDGAFTAGDIASVTASMLAFAVTIYSVVSGLMEASAKADQLAIKLKRAREVADLWGSDSLFSDQLSDAFQELSEEFTRLGVVANGAAAEGIMVMDIIEELGGIAMLTADQMKHLHEVIEGRTGPGGQRIGGLFETIAMGGVMGAKATKALDDVLSALGEHALKTSGLVDQFFLDQIKRARELGIELEKVTAFIQAQAESAEEGILAALGVTSDAYKKRGELQKEIADLTTAKEKQTGEQLAETTKKLEELNKELETQNAIIRVAGIHSAEAADAAAGGLLDIIASQVEAGKSFGEAIRDVAPGIEDLDTQMRALGLEGGPAFNFLRTQVELFKDEIAGPALTAMEGWAAGLRGLHNANLLTQETFGGLSTQIGDTYTALIAEGKDPKNVLIAMQGPLQTLWELQEKFGYKTDDATQALIDQAEAQGLVGEKMKPVQEQMLDATLEIRDAINDLVLTLGGIPGASKDAAKGLTDNFGKVQIDPITVPYTYTPTNTPGAPAATGAATGGVVTTTGVQRLADGGMVLDTAWREWLRGAATGTDTVPIMATPGEGIVTVEGMQNLGLAGLAALNRSGGSMEAAIEKEKEVLHQYYIDKIWSENATTDIAQRLDGAQTIYPGDSELKQLMVPASATRPDFTKAGGMGGSEVHYHDWQIAITALDATDLRQKVEHEILPMVIEELEDNRRGTSRRMSIALRRTE